MELRSEEVETWRSRVCGLRLPPGRDAAADAERVDLLRGMEDLKDTLAGLQAQLAVDLDASQRAQQAAAGEPAARQGRGVAAQVALARRESPHRGQVLLGLAKALHAELPHTCAALREGRLSEFRAQLIAQETACLEPAERVEVDEALCADPGTLEGLGTRSIVVLARAHAVRLDPASVVRRARKAESDRCVTLRPAPDTMAYLTALVPVAQGVAAYAALIRAAEAARASGDPRGKGQLMADTLVERLTGQARAADVAVAVNVVISDASLFGGGTEPADVTGYGPVPSEIARELIAHSLSAQTLAWIRRFYADPEGDLVAMTSRQRTFPGGLTDYLRVRDHGICRTPWCDAPIRDADHVTPAEEGGETSTTNGQGLCEACNHAKQAPGWAQHPRPGPMSRPGRHTVETTTPTGHQYTSTAPPPPQPSRTRPSSLDQALDRILARVRSGALA